MNQGATTGIVPAWARGVCEGLSACRSREVVYVPDNPLSHVLGLLKDGYPQIRATLATREEEAFGIAAGFYLGGARPAVLLQSSGLGNSINALTSLLLPYQIPMLIVVSMRGDAGEWNSAQVPLGRAMRPLLDALAVTHVTIEAGELAGERIAAAGAMAFGTRLPVVCLLPRRVTVPVPVGESR